MDEKRRRRLDVLQNITIVVLSLSAVILFLQSQYYTLGNLRDEPMFSWLESSESAVGSTSAASETLPAAPVHVAVSGTYGRYGSMTMTTEHEEFSSLENLLKEVLGSARTYTVCAETDYLAALSGTSVYYDFLTPLPLSVLANSMNISLESDLQARTMIISEAGNSAVTLYLWDGGSHYYAASTTASRNDLTETVNLYELGSADFAFDLAEDSYYAAVSPSSLFLRELPPLPVLSASTPLQNAENLLLALEFNPNTKSRYTEPNGTEVIIENERSLRISSNGSVHYVSGGTNLLTIESAGETPTLQEAVTGTNAFLQQLFSAFSGNAALYLEGVETSETEMVLRFGYQMDGIPIRFFNGSCAAEVVLVGNTISSMDLNIRQYAATTENSSLLPLRQALAIAGTKEQARLSIGYVDSGAASVSANWLAD